MIDRLPQRLLKSGLQLCPRHRDRILVECGKLSRGLWTDQVRSRCQELAELDEDVNQSGSSGDGRG